MSLCVESSTGRVDYVDDVNQDMLQTILTYGGPCVNCTGKNGTELV